MDLPTNVKYFFTRIVERMDEEIRRPRFEVWNTQDVRKHILEIRNRDQIQTKNTNSIQDNPFWFKSFFFFRSHRCTGTIFFVHLIELGGDNVLKI